MCTQYDHVKMKEILHISLISFCCAFFSIKYCLNAFLFFYIFLMLLVCQDFNP